MRTGDAQFRVEKSKSESFKNRWLILSSGLAVGLLLQHWLDQLKSCQEHCGATINWLAHQAGDNFTLFIGALAILLIALIVYLYDRLEKQISIINSRLSVQESGDPRSSNYLLGPYLKSKYGFQNETVATRAAAAGVNVYAKDLKQPIVRADEKAAKVRTLLNEKSRELSFKLARLRVNRIRERLDQLTNQIEQQTAIDNFSEFKGQLGELTGTLMYLTRSSQLFNSRSQPGICLEC